jgi:hypothetical protein
VLAGERLPDSWMEEITAPGEDDEDEQRTYTRLLTAIGDYRRRHHRAGPDVLGPRPKVSTVRSGTTSPTPSTSTRTPA